MEPPSAILLTPGRAVELIIGGYKAAEATIVFAYSNGEGRVMGKGVDKGPAPQCKDPAHEPNTLVMAGLHKLLLDGWKKACCQFERSCDQCSC